MPSDPYPGEAVEDNEHSSTSPIEGDNSNKMKELFLERIRQEDKETEKKRQELEVVSNEVEPFVLDQNFDYDNIVNLTPKFGNLVS